MEPVASIERTARGKFRAVVCEIPTHERQAVGRAMNTIAQEELRLREAYARRSGRDRYSWFNATHLYAMQELERGLLRLLRRHGFDALHGQRILEIGCGTAVWLREFVKWGASPERLTGIDLLEDRIAEARRVSPAGLQLLSGSATALLIPGCVIRHRAAVAGLHVDSGRAARERASQRR